MRLGVNIDHIATLRQARQEIFPDPIEAAKGAIAGGADGIVCHLREDRRHIQDEDVIRLRKLDTRLDLEMAATDEMVRFALKIRPDMITLVPEKRREITTEGGLDLLKSPHPPTLKIPPSPSGRGDGGEGLGEKIQKLQKAGILVSLFIDPEQAQIAAAKETGAEFIELHTGRYARASYIKGKMSTVKSELLKIKKMTAYAQNIDLRVNAGHGLDYNNVGPITKIPGMEELNIGFSIIARSVIVGMKEAVSEMRRAMQ
ncbi:MAG: pyridoxine 5'-phosphate synthase [Candidatus Margulisbacteria bacterium]|nr:pyridoxine 5'-phosphate synthase [Candidatus Margulisiibacteriota bacterium]